MNATSLIVAVVILVYTVFIGITLLDKNPKLKGTKVAGLFAVFFLLLSSGLTFMRVPYAVIAAGLGFIAVHVQTVLNGYILHGKPHWGHHLVRLGLHLVLLGIIAYVVFK